MALLRSVLQVQFEKIKKKKRRRNRDSCNNSQALHLTYKIPFVS